MRGILVVALIALGLVAATAVAASQGSGDGRPATSLAPIATQSPARSDDDRRERRTARSTRRSSDDDRRGRRSRSSRGSSDDSSTRRSTRSARASSDDSSSDDSRTDDRVREAGEDVSGPCDEAEHANDPRCTGSGAVGTVGSDDDDHDDDRSGHGRGGDDEDHDEDSGNVSGDDDSGRD